MKSISDIINNHKNSAILNDVLKTYNLHQTINEIINEHTNQYKWIKTTCGKDIIFDDEDYELLRESKLFIEKGRSYNYVRYTGKSKTNNSVAVSVVKKILKLKGKQMIRHKDGNFLNIKKENIEIINRQKAQYKKKIQKNNTSGYKGVSWNKNAKAYSSKIKVEGKSKHLGYFRDVKSAAIAYNEAAKKYFGENYALLNIIKDTVSSEIINPNSHNEQKIKDRE